MILERSFLVKLNLFKKGFTLAEVLIALTIVGVIAMLIMAGYNKTKPNKELVLFQRAYNHAAYLIQSIVEDEDLYTTTSLSDTGETEYQGHSHSGNKKLCELFASRLQLKTAVNCTAMEFSDGVASDGQFTSVDNIAWILPIADFNKDGGVKNFLTSINKNTLLKPSLLDYMLSSPVYALGGGGGDNPPPRLNKPTEEEAYDEPAIIIDWARDDCFFFPDKEECKNKDLCESNPELCEKCKSNPELCGEIKEKCKSNPELCKSKEETCEDNPDQEKCKSKGETCEDNPDQEECKNPTPDTTPGDGSGYYKAYFDINGKSGPNCFYNSETCKNPDRFTFYIRYSGNIAVPANTIESFYLKSKKQNAKYKG